MSSTEEIDVQVLRPDFGIGDLTSARLPGGPASLANKLWRQGSWPLVENGQLSHSFREEGHQR